MLFCSSTELFSISTFIELCISTIDIELHISTMVQQYTDPFEYRSMQFYYGKEFTVVLQYRIMQFNYRYRIILYRSEIYCFTQVHNSAILVQ